MKIFDYSFLRNSLLPTGINNQTNSIYQFRGQEQIQKELQPHIFKKLESIAKIQSVKNSNALEGIITTDDRIIEIINENSPPRNHDENEIAGYRDALSLIHNDFATLQVNEEQILNLFSIMQQYNSRMKGKNYKDVDNAIVSIDNSGKRKLHFQPVAAKDTPFAMEQLMLAYTEASCDFSINSLLLIPCFILDFLCIHPFIDGNGRMSRLLSLLLLYKNNFDVGKYISFEEQINKRKDDYYNALALSSQNWHENGNDYIPFMENFLFSLFLCYHELNKRFSIVSRKKTTVKSIIRHAINESFRLVSKRELANAFPEISIDAIESALSQLSKEGIIEKVGSNKNAKYKRASRLSDGEKD
jgi:Fic family protein